MKIEKTGYNCHTRKARTISAFIYDAAGELLDAIFPGEGNHKAAFEWAEWRAPRIPGEYPGAVKMVVHCGDDEIAVIDFVADDTPEVNDIAAAIEETAPRSAWRKGVKCYALMLLDWYASNAPEKPLNLKTILNGADDWRHYSEGVSGVALVGDCVIAEMLCNSSELKRYKGGELQPNSRENWQQTQGRALGQAWELITKTVNTLKAAAR